MRSLRAEHESPPQQEAEKVDLTIQGDVAKVDVIIQERAGQRPLRVAALGPLHAAAVAARLFIGCSDLGAERWAQAQEILGLLDGAIALAEGGKPHGL